MGVGEAGRCHMSVGVVVHRSTWCGWKACDSVVRGVRRGGGERLHYIMNAVVRVLEFDRHGAHNAMDVGCMGLERVGGGLNTHIRIKVNVMGKCGKFVIHSIGKFFYDFGKKKFGYKWGSSRGVVHRLCFLGDDLADGCVSETDGGWIWCGTIDASLVRYKVHPSS